MGTGRVIRSYECHGAFYVVFIAGWTVRLIGYYLDRPNCEQVPYNRTAALVVMGTTKYRELHGTGTMNNGTVVPPNTNC